MNHHTHGVTSIGPLSALLLLSAPGMRAQSVQNEPSLEQLMNIQVTSVNKKQQKLSRTAAAIFVITQEDIRRSGATNIPDVLRMAPGVLVAQVDSNTWAISIRGFNSRYSNKVLVLIDGRTVYSPSFSGVYWDQQSVPLEDIERIEVIRGPGATMWGANAVNGVINILTKPAQATQGGLLRAGSGNHYNALGLLRYGGAAGPNGSYRVFGEYTNVGDARLMDGSEGADGLRRIHGGFRSDWTLGRRDTLTLEGGAYSNSEGQTRWSNYLIPLPLSAASPDQITVRGGDVMGRWNHVFAGGSDATLQIFGDVYRRVDLGTVETHRSVDFDFQHHLAVGERHDLVWGLGYRATSTGAGPSSPRFLPRELTDSLYSVFFADEIRLADALWLTVGSKFEHNAYTGFEYEPGATLAWMPGRRHTLWFSAARAIRQPSRLETGAEVVVGSAPLLGGLPMKVVLYGNPHFQAEQLVDVEAGYRAQLSQSVSLDLAVFANHYHNLATFDPKSDTPVPDPSGWGLLMPLMFGNRGRATNLGGELAVTWKVSPRWQLSSSYSYMRMKLDTGPDQGSDSDIFLGDAPKHMTQVRSLLNVTRRLEFDSSLYYTSYLPNKSVPAHVRLDARLGWKMGESLEFSVAGQNLLRPGTIEFGDASGIAGTQAPRSVYGKVTWRF